MTGEESIKELFRRMASVETKLAVQDERQSQILEELHKIDEHFKENRTWNRGLVMLMITTIVAVGITFFQNLPGA